MISIRPGQQRLLALLPILPRPAEQSVGHHCPVCLLRLAAKWCSCVHPLPRACRRRPLLTSWFFLTPELPASSSTRLGVPKRTAELAAALDARVAELGGDRPIHSVLVANNGLAATKFMRSVRSWAYKNFGSERAGACGGVLRGAAGCCYVGGTSVQEQALAGWCCCCRWLSGSGSELHVESGSCMLVCCTAAHALCGQLFCGVHASFGCLATMQQLVVCAAAVVAVAVVD